MNRPARPAKKDAPQPAQTPKPTRGDNVVDMEARTGADSHMSLRLWLRLLTTTNLVQAELRRRLRDEFGTTLPRFDLMAQLERHPEGLKMSEISRRLMVTGGNVTGITDQLENEGFVARDADPNDRRAFSVRLTPAGRLAFDKMARAHEQWVVELLGGLGRDEKSKMHQRLAKLKAHLIDSTQR
ncbi:MarR family winged helix-turn-helix transcriptional regulator [Paraburkholderia sp. NMBU_R16]|uniref:MarR family winged helix-turn-helix transcriptional regulator n=1 Tax=Paraburkholderia sp. NMBU_R16 TaxID=2698676 RepID=UPI00349FCF93